MIRKFLSLFLLTVGVTRISLCDTGAGPRKGKYRALVEKGRYSANFEVLTLCYLCRLRSHSAVVPYCSTTRMLTVCLFRLVQWISPKPWFVPTEQLSRQRRATAEPAAPLGYLDAKRV